MVTKEMLEEDIEQSKDIHIKAKFVKVTEAVERSNEDADFVTTSDDDGAHAETVIEELTQEMLNEIIGREEVVQAQMEEVDDEEYEEYLKDQKAKEAAVVHHQHSAETSEEDDDDFDEDETLWERIAALKYALPFSQSEKLGKAYRSMERTVSKTIAVLGSGAWILATGAMMVLLPVALELEKEQAAISQENQARVQQNLSQQPPQLGGNPQS